MTRLITGNLVISVGVVSVPTVGMPLEFKLAYNSRDDVYTSQLGHLWRHSYMMSLNVATNLVTLSGPDGRRYPFNWDTGSSTWKQNPDSFFLPASLVDATTEWRLEYQDGRQYHFEHPTSGTARLTKIVDPNGNQTTLTWSASQTRIAEPRGREIVLDYYTTGSYTGFLEKITDPRGKVTTLVYTGAPGAEQLWKIMGPQGCTLIYTYKTGTNLIEKRTDPRSKDLGFEHYAATDPYPNRLKKVIDAERNQSGQIDSTVTGELLYEYDTVVEDIANGSGGPGPSQVTLFRTRLTDARGKLWEYRFDPSGNLWRTIDPLGRHTRNYWDSHQRLLFTTAGYPPTPEATLGPIENWNNSFWRRGVDDRGNLTQSLDPSGLLTDLTYDAANRLKSVTPGRAHFGVKGNWVGEYGSDGWILCGFDNGTDRQRLPGYVSQVSSVTAEPFDTVFVPNFRGIIEATAPVGRDAAQNPPTKEPLPERQIAFWKPSTTGATQFSFKVEMVGSSPTSFNLSLYAHSADLAPDPASSSPNPYPFAPLVHHEQYGRALAFKVTDLDGEREFTLPSDGAGVWTTFAVRGSSAAHVEVQVKALAPYHTSARLAAVAFDPVQNRTSLLAYDTSGNLTQTKDPLGNATDLTYWDPSDVNGPGHRLLKQVTDPRSKVTKFFYTDTARNLTRVEDPSQKSTNLTYDSNSNLLTVVDADSFGSTFTYDDKNRPLTIQDNASNQTSLAYDDAGNLSSTADPQSRVTNFAYTNMNRLETVTDDDGHVWRLAWDKAGNLVSAKDPRDNETRFEYDDAGQLVRIVQADTQKVEAGYDALGRLAASVTPNGTQTTVADVPTTSLR
ncbi:MAG: DUF6531 domain-containing protein, partial [bacterium]|nr:DUF6531 domain-containing protein [bacterium]